MLLPVIYFNSFSPKRIQGRHFPLSLIIRQEGCVFTSENQPHSPNNPVYRWIMSGFPAFIAQFLELIAVFQREFEIRRGNEFILDIGIRVQHAKDAAHAT